MNCKLNRREFVGAAAACAAAVAAPAGAVGAVSQAHFEVSVMESSLTRSLNEGKIDHLDFARIARDELKISAVEYASRFFADKALDDKYLAAMNKQAAEFDVRQLLIVVEGQGLLADAAVEERKKAVHNHQRWIDAAKALGCHSIQIKPSGAGPVLEQKKRAAESIAELCQYAAARKINVLLGDYGGLAADLDWIVETVKAIAQPCCGTHPQIHNIRTDADFARLAMLTPLAKAITAVSQEFDETGREVNTDYARALTAIQQAGYRGYVGIHYTGEALSEYDGVRATKRLMERVRAAM